MLITVIPLKQSSYNSINLQKYSLVPNRRPPPLINFLIFFHPGHSYSNPSDYQIFEIQSTQDKDLELYFSIIISCYQSLSTCKKYSLIITILLN